MNKQEKIPILLLYCLWLDFIALIAVLVGNGSCLRHKMSITLLFLSTHQIHSKLSLHGKHGQIESSMKTKKIAGIQSHFRLVLRYFSIFSIRYLLLPVQKHAQNCKKMYESVVAILHIFSFHFKNSHIYS